MIRKPKSKEKEIPKNEPRQSFILGGLVSKDEETFEKILIKLLDSKDIETKTEIQEPIEMTQFDIFADWLDDEGLWMPAKLVRAWAKQFRINMVSHKRQSRKEIIQALTEGLKQERTMQEKLMTKPS